MTLGAVLCACVWGLCLACVLLFMFEYFLIYNGWLALGGRICMYFVGICPFMYVAGLHICMASNVLCTVGLE